MVYYYEIIFRVGGDRTEKVYVKAKNMYSAMKYVTHEIVEDLDKKIEFILVARHQEKTPTYESSYDIKL